MIKAIKWIGLSVILPGILVMVFILIRTRDRHPGYMLDLKLPAPGVKQGELMAGFAIERITPELPDTWVDVDGNARFEPGKGDTWVDGNGNGRFDAFWLAGFGNKRAAGGIHDDLWARAVVWDDSASVVGLVVLDAIGFFNDDVITVRKLVKEKVPEIDHLIVASTHSHQAPDLMGLYGVSSFKSGVNPAYRSMVIQKTAEAVCAAYETRKPACLEYALIDSVSKDLIDDGRMPLVYDDGIRLMRVTDKVTGQMMGLLVNHGNHPETAGSKNLLITSDIVHYLRDGIERGINFVIGLANDEVGYIMPKSHWDEKPPYTYNEKEAPYGEINSPGPETGPELHRQIKLMLDDMR